MNKKQTIITTALSLLIIILVLLISNRLWLRFDVSAHKSWTISPVSKQLAAEITSQVRITYFVTDKLKKLYPFPGEVSDLIAEYVSFSQGKIRFIERDPAKTGLEDQMREIGIESREFQVIEKDQASFSNIYTGILIEYEDKQEVLPFVYRLDTLEYELTNRIRALVREKEKSAGIIVGEPQNTFNNDNEYRNLQQFLAQAGYKVRVIPPGDEIPDTLTELFVIGGASVYDDWALYRIDRYIQTGGKVFFALNSIKVSNYNGFSAEKIEDKGLLAMVASYGAQVEPSLVLDASALAMAAPLGQRGLRFRMLYPFYVHVLPESGNLEHPVSSVFQGVDLYWPNPLALKPPAGVEAAPLFTSTEEAWLQKDTFIIDPQQASQFASGAADSGIQTLGAALSGSFPSYWRGKPKPVREESDETLPDMPAGTQNARIIVVGNVEFLMGNVDFFFNQYTAAQPNFNFAMAAADWLSNDDDIISIRNRIPAAGALDRIIDPEKRVAAFSLIRMINTVCVPLVVLLAGILLGMRRKKAAYQTTIKEDSREDTNAL